MTEVRSVKEKLSKIAPKSSKNKNISPQKIPLVRFIYMKIEQFVQVWLSDIIKPPHEISNNLTF